MYANAYGSIALLLGIIGFLLTILIERILIPQPSFKRLSSAWAIHLGLYFLCFSVLNMLSGRIISSFVATLALFTTLVLINNTKVRNLNESLTAQDYEFITDIICHPRLFLPYFGIVKFVFSTIIFLIALVAVYLEPTPSGALQIFTSSKNWGIFSYNTVITIFFIFSCYGFHYNKKNPLKMSFVPFEDTYNFGLLPSLYSQAFALKEKPDTSVSIYHTLEKKDSAPLPNLIAVQSESFFDPRPFFPSIRPEILSHFDSVCSKAQLQGFLEVPAWGGNTVRTEFSFLTGLKQKDLEMHRFNPYVLAASGYPIPSLPVFLKKLGYKTVFIHPFVREFYKRDKVYSHWQADKYISIEGFKGKRKYGPYLCDIELTKIIKSELKQAEKENQPVFIFTVTMENHGPLHLEKTREKDSALYTETMPKLFDDLTIYLRHLKHANTMISILDKTIQKSEIPTSFCFYGDHVPIMPKVYDALTKPVRDSNYFILNNKALQSQQENRKEEEAKTNSANLLSADLSLEWLKQAGIV